MRPRHLAPVLVLALLAGCDGGGAATTIAPTTTVAPPTIADSTTPATAAVLPLVDPYDGTGAMTFPHFGDMLSLVQVEPGVQRITRTDPGDFGAALIGLYPGEYPDSIAVTLRFRAAGSDNTQVSRGIVVLGDEFVVELVTVGVLVDGTVEVAPALTGWDGGYSYFEQGRQVYLPADFNELTVSVVGGVVTVALNGTTLGTAGPYPVTTGRIGVFVATTASGDAIDLDEFSVEPIG